MKGYYFDKIAGKFRVRIRFEGRRIHIGHADTIPEAQTMYNAAQKEYFGPAARLVYVNKSKS